MVYHLKKFCLLRPLKPKRAAEVAFHLADVFLLLDVSLIFLLDNGSDFTAQIITELHSLWLNYTSFTASKDIHRVRALLNEQIVTSHMFVAWMADNNSADWTTGMKFLQISKNSVDLAGIKRSPYAAMFGVNARVGLTSTSLTKEIISCLQS